MMGRVTYMKTALSIFAFLFIVFAYGCKDDEPTPTPGPTPEPEQPEKIETDPNKTFNHPGMLHTQSDFDRIKQRVEANTSPWAEGWQKLTANSHASLSYNPNPVVKLIRGGNSREEPEADNYATAFNDAAAAYQCAIRWKVSGNDDYADKAIQILNAWASKCELINGNSNKYLASGIYGYQFANAAEIMRDYDGWQPTDFEAFKQWLLTVFYPLSKDFLIRHNNTCISHYWANWDLANIANIMAIGILCDRADIYNEAIDYLMDGEGNGQLDNAIYFVHNDGLAQLQESGRDQGHALLCVGFFGTIAEMAWNQGDDVYGYNDNKILRAAEYAARYNFNLGSVLFEPYNNCDDVNHTVISDVARGNNRPIWECIYNHYVKRKGLDAPNVSIAARMHRPEGGGGDYGPNSGGFDSLGFGTLMYSLSAVD